MYSYRPKDDDSLFLNAKTLLNGLQIFVKRNTNFVL